MSEPSAGSVIAELRIAAEQVVLGQALAAAPETVVEFERSIPTNDFPMPFLWVTGDGRHEFEAAIEDDPAVESLTLVDELDGSGLFSVEWCDLDGSFIEWLRAGDEGVLRAIGQADEWFLKVRFGSRERLSEFHTRCNREEIDFTVRRLYETRAPRLGQYDLTMAQRDALVEALELGYFDVPRQVKLKDVAEELDLSPNAVSERIRRGEANLFRSVLPIDQPSNRGTRP